MNNEINYKKVVSVIDHLLATLTAEQRVNLSERDTMATDDDLASVISALQRSREQISSCCLPPKEFRYRVLTRHVNDTWRLGSRLANEIADFEAMLEKL